MRPANLHGFWDRTRRVASEVRSLSEMTPYEVALIEEQLGARVRPFVPCLPRERPRFIRRAFGRRQPVVRSEAMTPVEMVKPAAPAAKTCSRGCQRIVWARGLCASCYTIERRAAVEAGTWVPRRPARPVVTVVRPPNFAGKPWTEEEDRTLLAAYPEGAEKAVAALPGRTLHAVQCRAYYLRKRPSADGSEVVIPLPFLSRIPTPVWVLTAAGVGAALAAVLLK